MSVLIGEGNTALILGGIIGNFVGVVKVVPVCCCRIGTDIILAARSQYLHERFLSFRPASVFLPTLVLIGEEVFQRVAI